LYINPRFIDNPEITKNSVFGELEKKINDKFFTQIFFHQKKISCNLYIFIMQIKIHEAYRNLVALCDTDLIGKAFEEDIRRIEINEYFFKGEEKNKDEIINILKDLEKEDAIFNIVGKESVECALIAKIISKEGIIMIQDVPVALGLM
jgi:uncharacterized protein